MRIAIITQDDPFMIPRNVWLLAENFEFEICAIIILDVKGSLSNRKYYLLRGFGSWQIAKMASTILTRKAKCFFNRLCRVNDHFEPGMTLTDVSRHWNIPCYRWKNLHHAVNIQTLRDMALDVIVSYSAPIVFKPKLLEIPRQGCINLHCSLLPKYAGLLPSFWVLNAGESEAGATVHYMDSKIDNGGILSQKSLPVPENCSMFELIQITKSIGGELMLDTLRLLRDGRLSVMPNPVDEGSYNTWPTVEEMRAFRKRGGRLI